MAKLAEGVRIVDADAHMTERHDLFTERAPKGYEDKVPHVEKIDGDGHVGHRRPHLRQGGLGWHHRPRRQEAPVHRLAGRVVGHRRRPPLGVGSRRAAEDHGRVRHRLPGHLPELDRHRRAEPRQHGEGPRAGAAVRRSSTTTPWPRCRRSRTTASSPCRSCRRGASTTACARRSAARRWDTAA